MVLAGIVGILAGFACMGVTMLAATIEGSPVYGMPDFCAGGVGLIVTILVGLAALPRRAESEPPETP